MNHQPRRFVLALLVSSIVVGMAPFVAALRDALEEMLGGGYVRWMGIGFVAAAAALLALLVTRIRQHRLRRYALLVLALALVAAQTLGWSRADARVNAVERIHFLYYGLLGFVWFWAFRPRRDVSVPVLTLLAVTVVSVLDEGVQWLVPVRTGELFDVGLNVYAGSTGVLAALATWGTKDLASGLRRDAATLLGRWLAAAALSLALFVHLAHLGYRIDDPEIGRFRSYFRLEELESLARDRARQWAREPPGEPEPLAVEDYYWTEAGWRVQHRNAAFHRGDFYQAYKENRLLEKYYGPFLDLSKRLPPVQLRQIEEGRPRRDPYPYVSPVGRDPHRIWLWPTKPMLWLVAGIFAAACLLSPRLVPR